MARYKVCPYCKTHNDASSPECSNCGTDIMGVKIEDDAYISISDTSVEDKQEESEPRMGIRVKVCPFCNHENPIESRICLNCNEELIGVAPTISECIDCSFSIQSYDGDVILKIIDKTEIGRECELAHYLSDKAFVSRRHCRFLVEGNNYFIEDLGSSNGTFVNGVKITEITQIKDGNEISLGDDAKSKDKQDKAAYFVVKGE